MRALGTRNRTHLFAVAGILLAAGCGADETGLDLSALDSQAGALHAAPTLSGLATAVLEQVSSPESLANSPVGAEELLSTDNRLVDVLVDGPEIYEAMKEQISRAKHEVDLAFFMWDVGSDPVRLIGEGIAEATRGRRRGDKLKVRLLVDGIVYKYHEVINGMYDSVKDWNLDYSRVDLQLATYPHWFLGSLHDKYIIVDGQVLTLTGANPELVHGYQADRWHDSGYTLEGSVARAALSSFDDSWSRAWYWSCKPRWWWPDCVPVSSHGTPDRSWMASRPPSAGTTPVIIVGRQSAEIPNNDTMNPQDLAWSTVMDLARESIHVETPNTNDDAFRDGVISAVSRGVSVKLLTSLGFNDWTEGMVGQGGRNIDIVQDLYATVNRLFPHRAHLLDIRYYSVDGISPVDGNGAGASHTKFMSIDGQIAIVGSGNMDTQSWNQSHELNVLIDGASEVSRIETRLFQPDWNLATSAR